MNIFLIFCIVLIFSLKYIAFKFYKSYIKKLKQHQIASFELKVIKLHNKLRFNFTEVDFFLNSDKYIKEISLNIENEVQEIINSYKKYTYVLYIDDLLFDIESMFENLISEAEANGLSRFLKSNNFLNILDELEILKFSKPTSKFLGFKVIFFDKNSLLKMFDLYNVFRKKQFYEYNSYFPKVISHIVNNYLTLF